MPLTSAPLEAPVCLFMVGMQCRSWRSFWKIPLIARRMKQMQKELKNDRESGLIWGENFTSQRPFTTLYLSYWKSSDHINRFVTDKKFSHLSSVKEYFQRFRDDPDIGVWHETYEVDPQKTENLYFGMAPFGVSAFLKTVEINSKNRNYLMRLRRNGKP
jgi:hypothetical protein